MQNAFKRTFEKCSCTVGQHASELDDFYDLYRFLRDIQIFSNYKEINSKENDLNKSFSYFGLFFHILGDWKNVNKKVADDFSLFFLA